MAKRLEVYRPGVGDREIDAPPLISGTAGEVIQFLH
jgi:hypothetical protein